MDPAADERLPVWLGFSEFFLDTELDASDHDRIASTLAATDYSLDELHDILRYEVYPPLKWNLLSVAGAWAGFDPAWLSSKLLPRKGRRPWLPLPALHWWMVRGHWRAVSELVRTKRTMAGR